MAFDLLVLQRAHLRPHVARLVAAFRRTGRPVLYDTDDLVFDPLAVSAVPGLAALLPPRRIASMRAALLASDGATCATDELVERVERLGRRAWLLRNAVSAAMQAAAHTTDDHAEAVEAFLGKRSPIFKGD